jgi:hypothetical protein
MSGNILDQIHKFEKEAHEKQQEAARLRRLLVAYPDIKVQYGRWEKVAYASKSVNGLVNECDMRHSCGCCSDSPLEVWPFLETPDGKVYSNPSKFTVGEKHYNYGDRAYPDWKKGLRKAGIPEALIQRVADHFREDAEERIRHAEEDGYDDEDGD